MDAAKFRVLSTESALASGAELRQFCSFDPSEGFSPDTVRIQAPDALYRVEVEGRPEGRCALWWRNTPSHEGRRTGLIGHFSARSEGAARKLLDAACAGLQGAGCSLAVGPMDGSTWRRYRLITWRAPDPPFFLEPDNPPEWPAYFQVAGFTALAQYYSSKCDDLADYPFDARLDARLRQQGLCVRSLFMEALDAEISLLWRMACDAFSDNFLYTPIAEDEFASMYAPVVRSLRPEFVQIAEHGKEPVAFLFAVPDLLQARANLPVDTLILKTLGVVKAWQGRGLGNTLIDGAFSRARAMGYRSGIFALMHESNVSRKMGHGRMRDIRRYTLFSRPL